MIRIINFADKTINGSVFTLSDLQLELQKYMNVETHLKFFKLNNPSEFKLLKNIKNAITKYALIEYDINECVNKDDIVITSYYVLINVDFSNIKAKSLIILDSLDVYNDIKKQKFYDVINSIKQNFENVYLLFNTFNYNLISDIENVTKIEYFSKLSTTRINKLKGLETDERELIRVQELKNSEKKQYLYNNRYEFINTLKFKSFSFLRMPHLDSQITVENFGKLFFEYLYLEREVNYYCKNKVVNDGMHYYMKKIGLDSNTDLINIKINKELLLKEIFYNDDDFIIKLLGELCTH